MLAPIPGAVIVTSPPMLGLISISPPTPVTVPLISTFLAARFTLNRLPPAPGPAKIALSCPSKVIASALIAIPFPIGLNMDIMELPMAGRRKKSLPSSSEEILTVLPSPPSTTIPPPLSTIPYPLVERISKFLKFSMVTDPWSSVYTPSS